jgi:fructose-1,6-bisphosphatase/inositol monophosphatase family enzyme
MFTSPELATLTDAVRVAVVHAGERATRVWQDPAVVTLKDARDPVTETDTLIENELRSALAALLPEAGFIVEEGQNSEKHQLMWVIDPIDQTKNFVGHVPLFYVQVALIHNGEPILAVIYNPVSKQLFSSYQGGGVTLNGDSLNVLQKTSLAECIVDFDLGGTEDSDFKTDAFAAVRAEAYRVRVSGGAYAPYLLTGGIDAFVVLNQTTKAVDQLPRMGLMREAGLVYERTEVGGLTLYLAGPKAITDRLLTLVESALP